MPLRSDKWPNFYFYDVTADKKIKVHKDHVKLKKGSTKGRGPGSYYAVVAVKQNSNGNDIYKWIDETTYDKLKSLFKKGTAKKSPKKSRKSPSRCNTLASGKKKTKKSCMKSKKCSWVKGKKKSRKSPARKGYCRKSH